MCGQCSEDAWFGVGAYYSDNGSIPGTHDFWRNNFDNITNSYGKVVGSVVEGRGIVVNGLLLSVLTIPHMWGKIL